MARTTSYYLYERYEKRGDQDWIPSYPNVYSKDGDGTMPLVVRVARDAACGWHCDPEYDWVDVPITEDYLCDECGEYGAVTHKWEAGSGYTCVGTTKYQELRLNVNYGNGWEEVSPAIIKPGNVLEENSVDCGYVYPRLIATLIDNSVKEMPYSCGYYESVPGERTCTINRYDMSDFGIPISQIKDAKFYHGYLIDSELFAGLQNITSATFVDGENVYPSCFFSTGLRTVSGKVETMQSYAFMNCKNLSAFTETSDKWHNAIIGTGQFANCSGLTSIDISKLGMYGYTSLEGGVGTGDDGVYLFGNCTNLRTAKIAVSNPNAGGTQLRNEIPLACFDGCSSLTDVDVYCGFEYSGLTYGWYSIDVCERAFFGCRNLSGITLGYHDYSAITQPYNGDPFYGGDTFIDINGVGRFAFAGCESLTVGELEEKLGSELSGNTEETRDDVLYSYSDGAFIDCKAFTHMPVPQYTTRLISDPQGSVHEKIEVVPISSDTYVTSVGNYTFSGCTGLQSLSFTSGLTSIGAHAFDGCTGLTSITVDSTTPPTLGDGAFDNTTCSIRVPSSSVNTYKSATGWSNYASRITSI